jgi:hypothetical protein
MKKAFFAIITVSTVLFSSCKPANTDIKGFQNVTASELKQSSFAPDPNFNQYWYAGKAELNSYDYTINRYDEPRIGYAVMIFVTEDLSKSKQVKLDNPAAAGVDRVPVLKLNALQRFQTGIYDYSLMSSLFTPVDIQNNPHSLKLTTTVQDWCGHVFSQLNLTDKGYLISQYSYFEMEGDKVSDTEGGMLEDEVFTRLRINPESVVAKRVKMIPNLTYTRLRHKPIAPQNASIEIKESEKGLKICTINYTDIKRRLEVFFETAFPYRITGFKEFEGEKVMSEARMKKSVMSAYWEQHDLKSDPLRKELGL